MTDSVDISPILEDLAAGRIDAAEAGRRIDALKAEQASRDEATFGRPQQPTRARESFRREAEPEPEPEEPEPQPRPRRQSAPEAEEPASEEPPGNKGITRVTLQTTGKRVRIVGDSSISTVSVEGQHVLRRVGTTMEIKSNGEVGPSFEGFSLIRPPRSLDDLRNIGLGRELVVRVNPKIGVDVEITGGGLNATDVAYFGKVRVTAAGASLVGVHEVSDLLVQAGSASVEGPIQRGRSKLRVESGNLTVKLAADSNVSVRAEAQLGKVSWPASEHGNVDELVLGNGSARLDVSAVMGWVTIKVEEDADAQA